MKLETEYNSATSSRHLILRSQYKLLISSTAEVAWNARNAKRFKALGYIFTKMKDVFTVKIEDLSPNSHSKVRVKCDYCGAEYDTIWVSVVKGRKSGVNKDCCSNPVCTGKKAADVMEFKHGVRYSAFLPDVVEKRKRTCLERYGVDNPSKSEVVKERIVKSNLERYGVEYSQQSPEVRAKTNETCLERYGVSNYVELFAGKFIGEKSPTWKGGVAYSRVERASHEYITWRKEVYSRDQYRCKKCGAKNERGYGKSVSLHAHHINNWADNPDKRYDVNNGITLCGGYHMAFHSKYGKRGNTSAQLFDFLSDEKIG